ncbi:hypothetical protein ABZ953_21120 [Streptomyces sp. NPDC046465]|uniref:hypothetical protein n=1 Tax=Streptomyces sp. NPDC046465 TaxID=3155810 RepID=UPI00340F0255
MSEGPRFCWRCDEPITCGQTVVTVVKVSMSAGGRSVSLHETCLKRPTYVRRTP